MSNVGDVSFQSVLVLIEKFTPNAVAIHDHNHADSVMVPASMAFIQSLRATEAGVAVGLCTPVLHLNSEQRADLMQTDAIVWLPDWKINELSLTVMGPTTEQTLD